mmetsp:Transcript_13393/g.19715  ORF Transcript_13393/g.19715 Transcript_13393/m.19715 type:complete len:107 (-) Transcript_13393:26-346(-)
MCCHGMGSFENLGWELREIIMFITNSSSTTTDICSCGLINCVVHTRTQKSLLPKRSTGMCSTNRRRRQKKKISHDVCPVGESVCQVMLKCLSSFGGSEYVNILGTL